MVDTTFVPGTPIVSTWLNDVNRLTYDLSSIATIAKGDALVGVKRTFTSAAATTQHAVNEWREINVVTDCGADPTGVADSTAAIQAAINAGRDVFIPAGTYKIGSSLTMPNRYGLVIRGEYQFTKLEATFAGAIFSIASGQTRQYITIDGITFRASGAGLGTATGISGNAGLAYVMFTDITRCLFSGTLRYGITGNFIVSEINRCSFGSDQTAAVTFKPFKLYATDSFQSVLRVTNCEINSGNDDYVGEVQWGYLVVFRGNVWEGNTPTAGVLKITDVLGVHILENWAESNGAKPFVKTFDGAHLADMRIEFNRIHHEGVGAGADDVLIDTTNASGKFYSLTNSSIQTLTNISRDGGSYDVQTENQFIWNNKAFSAPAWIEQSSFRGTSTNDNAPTGHKGEHITASQTTPTNFPATTVYGDGASISLSPGDWDVDASLFSNLNGATITGQPTLGVSTTSGNSSVGLVAGDTTNVGPVPTATANSSCNVNAARFSLSATTTIYLKVRCDYSAGNPQYRGRISARRVR